MRDELTRFKKGNPGGPGRPGMPQEVKAIRELGRQDLVDLGMMVFRGEVEALEDLVRRIKDPDTTRRPTPAQALMAMCVLNAIKKGDVTVLNSILDRFFGKTPIAIMVKASQTVTHYTPEQAKEEAKRILAEIAADGG